MSTGFYQTVKTNTKTVGIMLLPTHLLADIMTPKQKQKCMTIYCFLLLFMTFSVFHENLFSLPVILSVVISPLIQRTFLSTGQL